MVRVGLAWRRRLPGWLAGLGLGVSLLASVLAADGPPDATSVNVTGTWASTTGPERLIFLPGGYFRTCFAGGKQGNAAMGRWTRLGPGRYAVEFTHTAVPDCNAPPQAIRQHPASIRGQVLLSQGELALYVSGEFPPDLFRPVRSPALK